MQIDHSGIPFLHIILSSFFVFHMCLDEETYQMFCEYVCVYAWIVLTAFKIDFDRKKGKNRNSRIRE
jgi:hypothetical protein